MAPMNVSNIYECIERCCNKPQCDLIYWRKGRCHAVSCYTDELCKSSQADNEEENILVYINKRGHTRMKNKGILFVALFRLLKCVLVYSDLSRI